MRHCSVWPQETGIQSEAMKYVKTDMDLLLGNVKFFSIDRNYGFIEPDEGTKDFYFNIASIKDPMIGRRVFMRFPILSL